MFQYILQSFMCNAFQHHIKSAFYLLMITMLGGCTDSPTHRVAAEISAPPDDNAQYAVATRNDRIGRIVVPVTINNQPDFHLMLDTGATHSVLTSKAAARLGLDITQATVSEVQGVSGRASARIVCI